MLRESDLTSSIKMPMQVMSNFGSQEVEPIIINSVDLGIGYRKSSQGSSMETKVLA